MKLDTQGKAVDCYFNKGTKCLILKDWYRRNNTPCFGCPFFKTRQQFEDEIKKYPLKKKE